MPSWLVTVAFVVLATHNFELPSLGRVDTAFAADRANVRAPHSRDGRDTGRLQDFHLEGGNGELGNR